MSTKHPHAEGRAPGAVRAPVPVSARAEVPVAGPGPVSASVRSLLALALLVSAGLSGCCRSTGSRATARGTSGGEDYAAVGGRGMRGDASYYANFFSGRRTASGERYDPRKLTAANRTLPLGTKLKVTRLDSGRSVVVTVNDRGPFGKRRRILDLSRAAAERLDMIRDGHAEVRAEVID